MDLYVSALLGLSIAVLGVLITLFFQWKNNPRRKLETEVWVSPFWEGGSVSEQISVRYEERVIREPHVVTIVVRSAGRAEITSGNFDQMRPLEIHCGAPIVAELGSTGFRRGHKDVETHSQTVSVGPTLIRRGASLRYQVLCDGKPKLQIISNLIDTRITTKTGRAGQGLNRHRNDVQWAVLLTITSWLIMIGVLLEHGLLSFSGAGGP